MEESMSTTVPAVKMEDLSPIEYQKLRDKGETEIPQEHLAAEGAAVAPQTEVVEEKEVPEVGETQLAPASESGTEHEEGEEARKPGKGGWQRRIDKLTDRLRERDQELADIRAKSKTAEAVPAETAKPAPKSDKPKIEDFQSPDEWADARDAWKVNEERKAEFQERQRAVFDNFNKQVSTVREQNDDFDEVMNRSLEIPLSVQQAIPTLDNGAAVAYHIAKNPDIAAELMDMLPARAIAEVGRISERLLSASSTDRTPPVKKIVSKAEAPIQPVGGTAKSTVPLEDLPPREYQRIRNAEEAKRRAG
jgi:hypothetical protein